MWKLFKNKILFFIITRYFSYFLQFLNSIIIAYFLGPYYLGIWGFITLVLQYLSFGNLGIEYALNVTLSTGTNDHRNQSEIVSNALSISFITCFFFLFLYINILVFDIHMFEKYQFVHYAFLIILISCFNYLNVLFVNLFRIFSLYNPISIFQIIVQLLQLPVFFILSDNQLIYGLLLATLLGHLISFFVFIKSIPVRISFAFDPLIIANLYKRGIMLLFYNVTFYLLLLSSRTLVSIFYPVDAMGYLTFSSNIASALIIGLSSLEFILFPKMLNKLTLDNCNDRSIVSFYEIRKIYTLIVYFIIIMGLIFYPFLLLFFKRFSNTIVVFYYLAMCQLFVSSGFGYTTLIISRGKELFLVCHALIAIVINSILCFLGYMFFGIDYSTMALFLILAFIYYEVQVIRKGLELFSVQPSISNILKNLIPINLLFPLLTIVIGIITLRFQLFSSIALVLFLILNYSSFGMIKDYVVELIAKPSIINLNR